MDEKLKELRENTEKAAKFFTKIMAYTIGPEELKEMMHSEDISILDVRKAVDFKDGHLPKAISVPREELDLRYEELPKDKTYVVYCYNQQCHLGICACRFLSMKGYKTIHLDGGYKTWTEDFQYAITQ